MPSLTNLANKDRTKAATIDLGDGFDVQVIYRPALMTLANDVPTDDDPDAPSAMAVRLCKLIESWDITGALEDANEHELVADGETVPLDPDVVQHIPYGPLAALMQGLVRAETPDPRMRRASQRR